MLLQFKQYRVMKQRVDFSIGVSVVTFLCLALFAGSIFIITEAWWMYTWGGFIVAMLLISLYFCPLSITLTDTAIEINKALSIKSIPLNIVKTVQLYPAPIGSIRTCGSGGFLGVWGWFYYKQIGKYFAYYGKASDCFLVELTDGRKYLLGCKNAPKMVEAINSKLK